MSDETTAAAMKKETDSVKNASACLSVMCEFLLVKPLWLFLMYRVLIEIEASSITWTAYFVYLPTLLISAAIHSLYEFIKRTRS